MVSSTGRCHNNKNKGASTFVVRLQHYIPYFQIAAAGVARHVAETDGFYRFDPNPLVSDWSTNIVFVLALT